MYSLVKKGENQFHVRERVRHDLENLVERVPLPGAVIHFSRTTDYPLGYVSAAERLGLNRALVTADNRCPCF
jgi:hypothetical protein